MFCKSFIIRAIYFLVITLSLIMVLLLVFLVKSKTQIYFAYNNDTPVETIPFPVSVNPYTKSIVEQPSVEVFYEKTLAISPHHRDNWWNKVAATFSDQDWYQNLASPVSRIAVIWPGQRKEEAVKSIGDVLQWDKDERSSFMELMDKSTPVMIEGKYFPSQYVVHKDATPEDMRLLVASNFEKEVLSRYTEEVSTMVPLENALIIASLLEREASDFKNMREVSGVIWNRLFINMPLQLDATLQYIRGSKPYEPSWWPRVVPNDKYQTSPYNTYQHSGLPPTPIANPSTEAILAALNPIQTDCLFYFHTSRSGYHCSVTYEEHVAKLRSIYGRGS